MKYYLLNKEIRNENSPKLIIYIFILVNMYSDVAVIFGISWVFDILVSKSTITTKELIGYFAVIVILSSIYRVLSHLLEPKELKLYMSKLRLFFFINKTNRMLSVLFSATILLVSLVAPSTAILDNTLLLTSGITIVSYVSAIKIENQFYD